MLPYASLWDEVQGFEIIACMMRVFCQMEFSRNSRDNADPAGTESQMANAQWQIESHRKPLPSYHSIWLRENHSTSPQSAMRKVSMSQLINFFLNFHLDAVNELDSARFRINIISSFLRGEMMEMLRKKIN